MAPTSWASAKTIQFTYSIFVKGLTWCLDDNKLHSITVNLGHCKFRTPYRTLCIRGTLSWVEKKWIEKPGFTKRTGERRQRNKTNRNFGLCGVQQEQQRPCMRSWGSAPGPRHPQTGTPPPLRTGDVSKRSPESSAHTTVWRKGDVLLRGWGGERRSLAKHNHDSRIPEVKTTVCLGHRSFSRPTGLREPPSHHTWAKTEFSLVQKDSKQSLADSREDGPSSVALCATGLPRQWPSRSRYSAFCLLHKLPSPHSQASARGEAFPCQLFWKINKPTAIILTASADKCSKQQDTRPRFPNGIAFPFFFFGFDKFYRVALLRRGQVL